MERRGSFSEICPLPSLALRGLTDLPIAPVFC